jgi:hypothetical protein
VSARNPNSDRAYRLDVDPAAGPSMGPVWGLIPVGGTLGPCVGGALFGLWEFCVSGNLPLVLCFR